jgi:hypothetical protein
MWPSSASPQSAQWVTIGRDVAAFHEDVFRDRKIKLEPSTVNDVAILVELIGIQNSAKINGLRLQIRKSIGLRNAFAYTGQGYRTIVYDPDWAASAAPEFYLVLGHEAGHHFCGHEDRPQSAEAELEADRFGGSSIKRLEVYNNRSFFGAVVAAAVTRYPDKASTFYPSRASRLEALKKGYEQGSPCGGLAPVEQSGYNSGAR